MRFIQAEKAVNKSYVGDGSVAASSKLTGVRSAVEKAIPIIPGDTKGLVTTIGNISVTADLKPVTVMIPNNPNNPIIPLVNPTVVPFAAQDEINVLATEIDATSETETALDNQIYSTPADITMLYYS